VASCRGGQTQRGALVVRVAVGAVEAGEDRLALVVRDADAAVGHLEVHPAGGAGVRADVDLGGLSRMGVLDRVADQAASTRILVLRS
jgi:hypothetical protein